MPSPIAHLTVGYAIYRYYEQRLPEDKRSVWKIPLQFFLIACLSLLPDLDIAPAIIFRDMVAYHNNFSHSLIVALPVSLVIAGIFYALYRADFWLWFVICLVSYGLHVVMDSLTMGRGVMMFWPLTQDRFASPVKLFYGLKWGFGWFSLWHLWTVLSEALFSLGIILAVNYLNKKRMPQSGRLS